MASTAVRCLSRRTAKSISRFTGNFSRSSRAATILTADAAATLREAADSDATIIAILPPGTELVPLGETIESDGHTWVEVMVLDTGERGFIRTDFLEPAG